MKKILALLLCLCMFFSLCVTANADDAKTYKIGVAICQTDSDFITLYNFVTDIQAYFEAISSESVRYELTIVDLKDSAEEQVDQVETFVSQNMDIVFFNLVQTSSAAAAIDRLLEACIPVMLINGKLTDYGLFAVLPDSGSTETRIDYQDNSYYIGQVDANGNPHGTGRYTTVSGLTIDGEWEWCVNSVETYVYAGRYKFPGVYTGLKRNGKRCGYGTMLFDDGGSYLGEWLDDEKTGFGHRFFPDNSNYLGTFENGNKEGRGIMTYGNGSTKAGKWHNDQYAGS